MICPYFVDSTYLSIKYFLQCFHYNRVEHFQIPKLVETKSGLRCRFCKKLRFLGFRFHNTPYLLSTYLNSIS
jgi:hypothetical protein